MPDCGDYPANSAWASAPVSSRMGDMEQAHRDVLENPRPYSPLQDRLPPEIRNTIYELVLLKPDPINVGTKSPALLDTCKLVRQESLQMYIQRNAFAFTVGHIDDLKDGDERLLQLRLLVFWLRCLGPVNCSYLRRLQITLDAHAGALVVDSTALNDPWAELVRCLVNSGCRHLAVKILVPDDYTKSTAWRQLIAPRAIATRPWKSVDNLIASTRRNLGYYLTGYMAILLAQARGSGVIQTWRSQREPSKGLLEMTREAVWRLDVGRWWDGEDWSPYRMVVDFEEVQRGFEALWQEMRERRERRGAKWERRRLWQQSKTPEDDS